MSAPFAEATPIKLEETGENVTEIQSYLAGFQKEIGGDSSITQASGNVNLIWVHLQTQDKNVNF